MIIGMAELDRKLTKMWKVDPRPALEKGIRMVRANAQANAPVRDGELRNKIMTDVKSVRGGYRAECWPNVSYAAYVEFGTGPKGQANHAGISPEVSVAYSQSPWWIHEGPGDNEVDRATGEYYGWFYVDTDAGRFYHCSGQAAQPFMYPALKDHEDEILRVMEDEIRRQLK